MLAAGEAEVVVASDGARRRLAAGRDFDELALLHDIPRTATFTALTDLELYAVERPDFLAAGGRTACPTRGSAAPDPLAIDGEEMRRLGPPGRLPPGDPRGHPILRRATPAARRPTCRPRLRPPRH